MTGSADDRVFQNLERLMMGGSSERYSDKALELAYEPLNVGEIENADGIGLVKGSCGDRISIFIKLNEGFIQEISFLTDGCGATLACGSAVTLLAKDRTPYEARKIQPQNVIRFLDGLPSSHLHCATLAVQALMKALNDLDVSDANRKEGNDKSSNEADN